MSICGKLSYTALLLGIFLTSCTTSEQLTRWPTNHITYSIGAIHLDGISSDRANEVIHRAFKTWEATGIVKFKFMMTGQIQVSTKALEGKVAGFGQFPPYGELHLDSSNRTWSESLLYRVALHEIGHCLGLKHRLHENSVMYHRITDVDKLSCWDIEHLRGLYGLSD